MPTQRSNGRYYVQRTFPGVGKVYKSLHTDRKARAVSRERVLVSLAQQGRHELVRAFAGGDVSIQRLEEAFETDGIGELAAGLRRPDSRLADACEDALDDKAPDVKATTLNRYRTGLDHFRAYAGEDASVRDALEDIQGFKAHRLDEGVAEQTVNNDLGAVSVLATYALEQGWIEERPEIKRYDYKARIRYMERGDIAAYMAAIRRPFRCQQLLLLSTGMRLGESEAVRECDIQDKGGEETRINVRDSKTATGVRSVFVPPAAANALRAHVAEHGVEGTDRLFTIKRRTVQAEHNRTCDLVGLVEYTIHDHRHTAAVALVRAGTPLHLVQRQLGHKHIEQTMKYAAFHPGYSDMAPHFEKMEAMLGLRNNNPNNTPSPEGAVAGD